MRVGLVNPYALDTPGGVQAHVVDLAEYLISAGHEVSLLTPSDTECSLPPYAVWAGKAVPVPYNGSVARVAFSPAVSERARQWLDQGSFDVVHLHEPASPSVSLLALRAARGPIVATFHSSQEKSRSLRLAGPMLRPSLEKISGRIAVSAQAHDTVLRDLGGSCVVIPNGVKVERFAGPDVSPGHGEEDAVQAVGGHQSSTTLVFLGRFTEPRKGLDVLLKALPRVFDEVPGARLVVAGPGERTQVMRRLPEGVAARCEFTGPLTEPEKAALLRRADVYLAPNTGGESFGIILVEAMAAGAPVLAADLPAFREVLDDGRAGELFPVADPGGLADALVRLLGRRGRRHELARRGPVHARRYDWSQVGRRVLDVYDSVRVPGTVVRRVGSPVRRPAKTSSRAAGTADGRHPH
jgi:phosphatidylinositol alpha-mannosyltransferase